MIKSYWKVLSNERPRKYYTILADGKKQLEHTREEVDMVYSLFGRLLSPTT
jgi:PadR family transcriptional regulator, regulatory protein PadR